MTTSRLFQNSCLSKHVICAISLFMLFVAVALWPQKTISAQTVVTTTTELAPSNSAPGKSTVSGRVVYDDTGKPVRRAHVSLIGKDAPAGQRMTNADARGVFRLKNVPAGRYTFYVDAVGVYSPNPYGPEEGKQNAIEVSVDGTSNVEVEVRARRGGSINGKITYTDGEPAVGLPVSLMRREEGRILPFRNGRYGDVRTDDRGVYRVSGLPPGEYIVSASEEVERVMQRGDSVYSYGGGSLSATYYPAATSARSASGLRVEAGREVSDINITLIERSTHKVSGTVTVKRDGTPLVRAQVMVQLKTEPGDFADSHMYSQTDERGYWTLEEVPDGTYIINVTPPQPEMRGSDGRNYDRAYREAMGRFVAKNQDLTVAGADVSGLAIEMSEGARIRGTLRVEGDKPLPQNIYISAEAANGERVMQPSSRVEQDNTWIVGGLPAGDNFLNVGVAGGKYYTKSITWNGMDLQRNPVNLDEGGEVKGVEIVLSTDVATLTGRALNATDGAPLRNMVLILVPTDQSRWRSRSASLGGRTGADGSFTITGAPGEYFALIWRMNDGPLAFNEENIRARTANAPRVTLRAGERKSMDISVPVIK
ncbi:MAG: carboxypeptidase regulatory-like domain-containing protein [Pyrinomonadaceae bacterium]